jgi:hypothetical protein
MSAVALSNGRSMDLAKTVDDSGAAINPFTRMLGYASPYFKNVVHISGRTACLTKKST